MTGRVLTRRQMLLRAPRRWAACYWVDATDCQSRLPFAAYSKARRAFPTIVNGSSLVATRSLVSLSNPTCHLCFDRTGPAHRIRPSTMNCGLMSFGNGA